MKLSFYLTFVCMLISMQTGFAQLPNKPKHGPKTVSYHYTEEKYSYRSRIEVARNKWKDGEKEMYFFISYSTQESHKDFPFPNIVNDISISEKSLYFHFRNTNCFNPGYWYNEIPLKRISIGDTLRFNKNAERHLYIQGIVIKDIKHNYHSSSLSQYQFQILGSENELIYTLNYIHGLGFTRITSSRRNYHLTHINHTPIDQFINKYDQKILDSFKYLDRVNTQASSQP